VAEIGGNHGGSPELAALMVRAAARSGFGLVKFQAYRTGLFLHRSSPFHGELGREELPFAALSALGTLARDLGLGFGLSVFGPEGLELALSLGADFVKISSGDLNHHPLIRMAAASGLPLVISTGAAAQAEVDRALALSGPNLLAVLQCTSLYPAPEGLMHLAVMDGWLQRGLPAGLSDHSLRTGAMRMAFLLGAAMIEKHFTTDRGLPGGDNAMSLTPDMMEALARELRGLGVWGRATGGRGDREMALGPGPGELWGSPVKEVQPGEEPRLIRRWAVCARDLKKGQPLDPADLAFQRLSAELAGGDGLLGPDMDLAGLSLLRDAAALEPLRLSDLEAPGRRAGGGQAHRPAIRLALAVSHLLSEPSLEGRKLMGLAEALEIKGLPEPSWLPGDKPRVFHSGLGLVEEGFVESFGAIGPYLAEKGVASFSCDLGPAAERYQGIRPASRVLSEAEIEARIAESLRAVRKAFPGQVAVENYNYYPTGLYEHVCRPDFIHRILRRFDLGLVLDLAHAAVTAHNQGLGLLAYLRELPLERVEEIHLSKPYLPWAKGKMACDAHLCPSSREIRWLSDLLKILPARDGPGILLVVEFYGQLDELYKTMSFFKRILS
jgi:sialic acid synthase SpsE